MQYDIPFIESLMPPLIFEEFERMNEKLPPTGFLGTDKILAVARSAVETVRGSMEFLKTYCEKNPFQETRSEILFFKVIKPHFQARLIYWTAVFDTELQRPVGGLKHEMKYLKKKLCHLYDFFELHEDFYKYYRSGRTEMDEIYFLKTANPLFSSAYDGLVAEVIANNMIRTYLLKALSAITSPKTSDPTPSSTRLQWTASKAGLVELIYALESGGVFNHGNAPINEIAGFFQEQFDVHLVNFYHTFNEIRLRKKNRTALLETMREKLIRKMDALDGR